MSKVEQKKSNFKILAIDDSNISLSFISDSLLSAGYTTLEQTSNPKEGLQLIQNLDFHLYIIDLVMPDLSGIELARNS